MFNSGMTHLQAHGAVPAKSLVSSLWARACLMPAAVITAHYRLYVVGDTAMVRLSASGDSPRCVVGNEAGNRPKGKS